MSESRPQPRLLLEQRVGEQLGRYELLRIIGRGGMGEVYKARAMGEAGFEKLVVVKLLRAGSARPAELEAALVREAHLGVSLDHEGIAQVLDLGREGDTVFLVMEYVHGFHFGHLVRHAAHVETPLPVWAAVHVARRVLGALAYLHELRDLDGTLLGLVHRDVSPSNILVGVDGRIKLADLGIAKVQALADESSAAVLKGKLAYMPPESLGGEIDRRYDVFSVGVILYEALAGRRPFDAADAQVLLEYKRSRPPPLTALRAEVNEALDAAVQGALALKESRFESARAMQDALDRAVPPASDERERFARLVKEVFALDSFSEVTGGGLAAIDPSTRSDSAASVRDKLLLAQVMTEMEGEPTHVAGPDTQRPPPPGSHSRLWRIAAPVLAVLVAALLVIWMLKRPTTSVGLAASASAPPSASAPVLPALRFGFSPARGLDHARSDGARITELLSDPREPRMESFVAADYAALVDELGSGRIDLAWLPPLPYLQAAERGARAMVLFERAGQVSYRGALVVRKSSDIRTVAALRGKKAGWVDKSSSSGYLFPREIVQEKVGGSLERFFASEELLGSHEAVCNALVKGWIDVGATFADTPEPGPEGGACQRFLAERANQLRVIAVSSPIPGDCIAARPGLDAGRAEKITQRLLGLEKSSAGKSALAEVFAAERPIRAEIGAYDRLRRAAERTGARPQ